MRHFFKAEVSRAELDVLFERRRQVQGEGFTAEHDDRHTDGSIAAAAACYAYIGAARNEHEQYLLTKEWWGLGLSPLRNMWRWEWRWFKPKNRRRNLVKAGALIIAEIERIDRAAKRGAS